MADNKNEKDDQSFEFDWGDDGFGDAAGADESSSAFGGDGFSSIEDDIFGGDDLEGTDDPFGGAEENLFEADGDVFGGGDDSAFEMDEDNFGLQSMPTPGAFDAGVEGDPDKEFDDISEMGDASPFADDDGFNDTGSMFESADDDSASTPDDGDDNDDIPDVFQQNEGDSGSGDDSAHSAKKAGLTKKVITAGSVLAVGIAAYIGYNSMYGMQGEYAPPPHHAEEPIIHSSFPSGLPGQSGGIELPTISENLSDGLPMAEPEGHVQPLVEVVAIPDVTIPQLGEGNHDVALHLDALPTANESESLSGFDDLVGGPDRGGLDAIRANTDIAEGLPPVSAVDFSEIEHRLEIMEKNFEMQLSALANRLDGLSERVRVSSAVEQGSTPAIVPQEVVHVEQGDISKLIPPLKPLIVETASLKGVSRDLAWVSTSSGVVEVRVGDMIPGAGRVNNIVNYDGKWMIISDGGLVIQ